jgi:AMMECR1 domain-containing protein
MGAIGVPCRDPNGKTAIMQMANDAAAEKPRGPDVLRISGGLLGSLDRSAMP